MLTKKMCSVSLGFLVTFTISQMILDFSVASGHEGFRGRVTQHGLNYASRVAVDMLVKFLPVAEIPNLYERMGRMSVDLSNITILEFQRPELDLDLVPNTKTSSRGLKTVFSRLDPIIECHMKMTYNWGLFSTTRELFVTIATSNLSLTLDALIGIDGDGNGEIEGFACQLEGNVQIASKAEETSTFSGLFDFVASNFKEKLKGVIFSQACHNIILLFNTSVHTYLSATNMSRIVLDEDLLLNVKFTDSPKVTDSYLETSHMGEMLLTANKFPPQRLILRPPPTIPAFPDLSSRMVYTIVTDRTVNSIWDACARSNKLRFPVKSNSPRISNSLRRYLRTSCSSRSHCIGSIYPQLKSLYRQSLVELEMEAKPSQTQYFRFRGSNVQFQIPTTAEFFIKTKNSSDLVMSLSSVWKGSFQINAKAGSAYFNFTKLSVTLNNSRIHHERLLAPANSELEEFLKSISRRLLLPFLKEFGSSGYPLEIPTLPWMKLLNTEISNSQNLIVLGTDVRMDIESIPDLQDLS